METLSKLTLVFLHGFGGGPSDFDEVISYLPLTLRIKCLTLPGHERAQDPMCLDEEIKRLGKELGREENLVLCGYSMGGRFATLLSEKIKLKGLILLSSGLGGENERRLKKDQEWAKLLTENTPLFWKKWYEQNLFASLKKLPEAKWQTFLKKKEKHNASNLAQSLENFSPANHQNLMPYLKAQAHLLFLVGSLDEKYSEIAKQIENEIPKAQVTLINQAGHNLPLEAPKACAQHIEAFLQSLKETI